LRAYVFLVRQPVTPCSSRVLRGLHSRWKTEEVTVRTRGYAFGSLGLLASSFSPRKSRVLAGGAFTTSQIAPVSIYVLALAHVACHFAFSLARSLSFSLYFSTRCGAARRGEPAITRRFFSLSLSLFPWRTPLGRERDDARTLVNGSESEREKEKREREREGGGRKGGRRETRGGARRGANRAGAVEGENVQGTREKE